MINFVFRAGLLPMKWSKNHLSEGLLTYIGNKRALLPFVDKGLRHVKRRLDKNQLASLDLFSGSGVISRLMKLHSSYLVSNDFEDYAEVVNQCYLTNFSDVCSEAYETERAALLRRISEEWKRGIIAENYAPLDDNRIQRGERVFFTRRNSQSCSSWILRVSDIYEYVVPVDHF